MYDRLCAAVTTVMAGLVLVDINKTKDIVMQLWGGLTLICIENLLDLHRFAVRTNTVGWMIDRLT